MSDEETAGTTEGATGDAEETQTTESTPEADRDATSETEAKTDVERLNLEWKHKAERVNELEAKLLEQDERLKQLSPAQPDASSDLRKGVEHFKDQKDPVAAYMLHMEAEFKRQLDEIKSGTTTAFQATDIEDKSLRREVLDHFEANRHRLADLDGALAEVNTEKQAKQITELKAALEKANKSKVNDQETVATSARSISAANVGTKKKLTFAQFDKEQARIRETEGAHAAMLYAGKIGTEFDLE